jgi:hypothetical protein
MGGKKEADRCGRRSASRFPIHSVGLLLALGLHDDRQGPDLNYARALHGVHFWLLFYFRVSSSKRKPNSIRFLYSANPA